MITENEVYAVKRGNEWWAVIDCGTTRKGGMCVATYWLSHFENEGNTYRWFRKITSPPKGLEEWQQITVKEEVICKVVDDESDRNIIKFEDWDDVEDGGLQTLQNFAKLLGKDLSIKEVYNLINHKSLPIQKQTLLITKKNKNIVSVSYKNTRSVAFLISGREYGNITDLEVARKCYDFFKYLFPTEKVTVEITYPRNHTKYTEIEVQTPTGLKTMQWSWESNIQM